MTERMQVYKCDVCGNVVVVLHAGAGQLVCCGQPVRLLAEKTAEEGKEKHVPVVERVGNKIRVKVGSVAHPMEPNHYIEWVSVEADDKVLMKFLAPGEKPEAEFDVIAEKVKVRSYCNVHGLWKAKS